MTQIIWSIILLVIGYNVGMMGTNMFVSYVLQIYFYTYRLQIIVDRLGERVVTKAQHGDTLEAIHQLASVFDDWDAVKSEFKRQSKAFNRFTAALCLPLCFATFFWTYFLTRLAGQKFGLLLGAASFWFGMNSMLVCIGVAAPLVSRRRDTLVTHLFNLQASLPACRSYSRPTLRLRILLIPFRRRILRHIYAETNHHDAKFAIKCGAAFTITHETAVKILLEISMSYLLFLQIL